MAVVRSPRLPEQIPVAEASYPYDTLEAPHASSVLFTLLAKAVLGLLVFCLHSATNRVRCAEIVGNQSVVREAVASYERLGRQLEAFSIQYAAQREGARNQVRLHFAGSSVWAEITCLHGPVAFQGPNTPRQPNRLLYSWSGQRAWLYNPQLLRIRKTRTKKPQLPNLAGTLPNEWMLNLGSLPWTWADFLNLESVREAFTQVTIDDRERQEPTVTFMGPETSLKLVLDPTAGMMVRSFEQSGTSPGLFRGEYEYATMERGIHYPAIGRMFTDTPSTRASTPDFEWVIASLEGLKSPTPTPGLGKLESIPGMVITSEDRKQRVVGSESAMAQIQKSLHRGINEAQNSAFFTGDIKRD